MDEAGVATVIGLFGGAVDFGTPAAPPHVLSSVHGSPDVFAVRLDPQGATVAGAIALTGYIQGAADFTAGTASIQPVRIAVEPAAGKEIIVALVQRP